jgi:hypothetical protein
MKKTLWLGSVLCASLGAGSDVETVGRHANGRVVLPVNQVITPAGKQIELPGMRAQGLALSPDALAFAPDGRTLYVANGTQNAVAVIRFDPSGRESKLLGLIPVGWYPGTVCYDERRKQLCVANIKSIAEAPGREGYNSKQFHGTVSLVPLPKPDELPRLSQTVWDNLRQPRIAAALLPPRPGQSPRAIPERIGEPSLIKHVVYIIKENRTYDQVLGDVTNGNGNGNAQLCIFGERVTPNQHKLVREFALLDNTCCAGILSADRHQWSLTAFGSDYLEKSFCGWPRSYPDGCTAKDADALAYAPSGFIWDNALRHQISFRNYGEFMSDTVH